MFVGWIGRMMRSLSAFAPPETRTDLAHVADELIRLDRRPRQPRPISR